MKRLLYFLLSVLLLVLSIGPIANSQEVVEINSPELLITVLQVASVNSASEELIQLTNTTDSYVALNGWQFQYKSASASSNWLTKLELSGWIEPNSSILITSNGFLDDVADFHFSAGLANTAGHVRVINTDGEVVDLVAWGATASSPETNAATVPNAGELLVRASNEEGKYQDSDDNSLDFSIKVEYQLQYGGVVSEDPNPSEVNEEATDTEEIATEEEGQDNEEIALGENEELEVVTSYDEILLSELLPDPVAPEMDSEDEWIEIYNPNDRDVDLKGYVIESGNSFSYSFTFGEKIIPAYSYLVLRASESSLVLSNSGSSVQLLNPLGAMISTTSYGAAKPGVSWAISSDVWAWTSESTPGSQNTIIPLVAKPSTAKQPKATTKKTNVKAATNTKKSTKSTTEQTVEQLREPLEVTVDNSTALPLPKSVLAGVVSLTILYIGYEYRYDIGNTIYRSKRYTAARRKARA